MLELPFSVNYTYHNQSFPCGIERRVGGIGCPRGLWTALRPE